MITRSIRPMTFSLTFLEPILAVEAAAVHCDRFAADPARPIGGKKHHHVCNLLRVRRPVLRLVEQALAPARGVAEFLLRTFHVDAAPPLRLDSPRADRNH